VDELVTVLAATSPSSSAEPGTLAFLVIFGMAVVLFFLFRSMSKHLRKVNAAARQNEASAASGPAAPDPAAGDMTQASPPDRRAEP
jgi:hypothetical protein